MASLLLYAKILLLSLAPGICSLLSILPLLEVGSLEWLFRKSNLLRSQAIYESHLFSTNELLFSNISLRYVFD